jgi:hypothetical protein
MKLTDCVNYSFATLNFLQVILQERFGHAFILKPDVQGRLKLSLSNSERSITFISDSATFTRADSNQPCTHWDAAAEGWQSVLGLPLPAPGAVGLPMPLITPTDQGMHVAYDILGLTYWMLSRQEEVGRIDLDAHGRFPATSSHAYKHDYLERPVVDEWLHILGQVMQRTWPGIELKQHSFSMKVSHDVDRPSRYGFLSVPALVRAMAGDVIKRRDFKSAMLAPWVRMNTRTELQRADPANTFDWIMDVSEQHDLQSAFYFICGHTDARDADYQPEHPAIRHLMRRIHQRGHEIGLHPSYGTYQKPQLIRQEADRLRKVCGEEGISQTEWGGRMHYLRWKQSTTLRACADAGMAYDSTLCYADRPGFRCGTCFEYPAFDPVAQEALSLRIRPLIAMECTVMASRYMGLGSGDEALAKFVELKNTCSAVGGCFTLLWHNTQLEVDTACQIYQQILNNVI